MELIEVQKDTKGIIITFKTYSNLDKNNIYKIQVDNETYYFKGVEFFANNKNTGSVIIKAKEYGDFRGYFSRSGKDIRELFGHEVESVTDEYIIEKLREENLLC